MVKDGCMSIDAAAFASMDETSPNSTSHELLSEFACLEKKMSDFPIFVHNSKTGKRVQMTLKQLQKS